MKNIFITIVICILIVAILTISPYDGSIQGDMNNFEDQLTGSGVNNVIDNSNILGSIGLKVEGVIASVVNIVIGLIKKITSTL